MGRDPCRTSVQRLECTQQGTASRRHWILQFWKNAIKNTEFSIFILGHNRPQFSEGKGFQSCTKTRSNHQYKIQTKLAKLNCYKYSLFVEVIKYWNDLPSNEINCHDSPNIRTFKLRSKNHMNIYVMFKQRAEVFYSDKTRAAGFSNGFKNIPHKARVLGVKTKVQIVRGKY